MKEAAIRQAVDRLDRARDAVASMERADSHATFSRPWSEFLLAANSVYSKLEQGAKGYGASQGWYGRKKHDRRHDELLSYLHHTRNADEHDLEASVLHVTQWEKVSGQVFRVEARGDSKGNAAFTTTGDKDAKVQITKFVMLKEVRDARYGDVFAPPKVHLGQPLGDEPRAIDVARLGLAYLERLVAEAAQLPQFP